MEHTFSRQIRQAIIMITLLFSWCAVAYGNAFEEDVDLEAFGKLAVQNGGRIKPMDTFAREQIKVITNRERFEDRSAVLNVLSIVFGSEDWQHKKIIKVDYLPLVELLGAEKNKRYIAPHIISDAKIQKALQQAWSREPRTRAEAKMRHALEDLDRKLGTFENVARNLLIIPEPGAKRGEGEWMSVDNIRGYDDNVAEEIKANVAKLRTAFREKDAQSFNQAVARLGELQSTLNPEGAPDESMLALECAYNSWKFFKKSYLLYLLAMILFVMTVLLKRNWLYYTGNVLLVLGLGVHTVGLVVRSVIGGRLPLSNSYEYFICFIWGTILCAVIFQLIYRMRVIGLISSVLGFLGMVVGSNLPIFDDKSITPLVAILRSSWLTYHVVSSMLAYGALFLACGISVYFLLLMYLGRDERLDRKASRGMSPRLHALYILNYRVIQVGFLLLTVGVATGAIWADSAWGRYWGWDPKETWSLVTWVIYLIYLHLPLALPRVYKWLGVSEGKNRRTTALILSYGCVVGFLAVIFTYFGVNYLLPGLHSYA